MKKMHNFSKGINHMEKDNTRLLSNEFGKITVIP